MFIIVKKHLNDFFWLLKRIIRYFVSIMMFMFFLGRKKSSWIYCSLRPAKGYGGPNRFLVHFLNSEKFRQTGLKASFLSPWNCRKHLIFSFAWSAFFYKIASRLGCRTVLRVDGFHVPDFYDKNPCISLTSQELRINENMSKGIALADHVIYQSNFSKYMCDEYLVERRENYTVIYNGVDLQHFKPTKSKSEEKPLTILLLAKHFTFQIDFAVKVFNALEAASKCYEFIIVGPLRDSESSLSEYLNSLDIIPSLSKKITVVDGVDYADLPKIHSNADIFLHLKKGDWCPNAVVEALASGLPTVCPELGGTAELVGEAGEVVEGYEWHFTDDEVQRYSASIETLAMNLRFYQMRARSRALEYFNIEDVALRYFEVIQNEDKI